MAVQIIIGDALTEMRKLPDQSAHCCVTSPPYWGLRDYGVAGQIGLEETPFEWRDRLVEVFREVRRVLRDDGTLWLNLGDKYADMPAAALKPKDLLGQPWMIAFALRDDGWWLRRDIIWSKPNPMPESVVDRPTTAHEYVFLMTKSDRYQYDAEATKEPVTGGARPRRKDGHRLKPRGEYGTFDNRAGTWVESYVPTVRNIRSVWTIKCHPFPEAHFATFPPELARRCILAGCPEGGTVLDPFGGAGTTGLVADRLQRNAILIELNPEYAAMARGRIESEAGLFVEVESNLQEAEREASTPDLLDLMAGMEDVA